MSQQVLDSLLLNEDIQKLKAAFQIDPYVIACREWMLWANNELAKMINIGVPCLDATPLAIREANLWLQGLQNNRDTLTNVNMKLDDFELTIDAYYNRAHSITMIQPQIETGLKSNDQRNAYFEQVFDELVYFKSYIDVIRKKSDMVNDSFQSAFFNVQQQQKNLQLVSRVINAYGTPVN
jgi:hypothetical protein